MKFKAVTINNDAFLFCRYGVAILLWIAFFFRLPWLVAIAFIIFAWSALVGVDRAPMIKLFDITLGRLRHHKTQVVIDVYDMRFVHSLAAAVSGVIYVLLLTNFSYLAWSVLFVFCILKSLSAYGYCPASKLRSCALGSNGSCCTVGRALRR